MTDQLKQEAVSREAAAQGNAQGVQNIDPQQPDSADAHATPAARRSRKLIKRALVLAIPFALAVAAYVERDRLTRIFAGGANGATSAQPSPKAELKVLYWQDPMHPAYKSDKPGKAPDCGMDLVPVYEGGAAPNLPEGSFLITPEKQQMIGVTYGEVASKPLSKTLRTVGRVAFDETKIVRVHTKVEGWIEKVFVDFTGKLVEKDQPLVSIYSPDLVQTQQEYLLAMKSRNVLSESPFREAVVGADSLFDSARKRLELWDITDDQIKELEKRGTPTKTLTLYAPSSGFVLTRNAYPKQRVTPDTELYAIADLSTVWVIADIYEYEAQEIQVGQPATMTLTYSPGRTFRGAVSYIYPQLDNATRTLKVRVEFPNPGFALKPDMYADVQIKIDYGKKLVVPQEAVLDSGSEQIVFVSHEGGYFEPRKIQVGARVDNIYIVLAGLKPGEKIVTSANFLIDSESRLKSAAAGMGMPGMSHGAPSDGAQPPVDHSGHQRGVTPQPSTHHPESKPKAQPQVEGRLKHKPSGEDSQHQAKPERQVLYWYDPMHPNYKSDKPGKAPDCGMDLVPKYADGK